MSCYKRSGSGSVALLMIESGGQISYDSPGLALLPKFKDSAHAAAEKLGLRHVTRTGALRVPDEGIGTFLQQGNNCLECSITHGKMQQRLTRRKYGIDCA